ncbi:MAG: alpha/beta fold hydrolase [Bacteroidota bacterium]|jgi:dienelactone hydrolase
MKTLLKILFLCTICVSNYKTYAQANKDLAVNNALLVIDLFKTEEYDKAYAMGDTILKRRITAERFQGLWESLSTVNGELVEIGKTNYDFLDTLHVTTTKIKYKNGSIGMRLTFNLKWEIVGLFVVDAEPMYHIPEYSNPFGFYEIKIPFGPPGFENDAILSVPIQQKKYPCVIIIGGSGPIDKDATIGPNKIYKDLSWGLANQGIASVRFDKRTKNYFGKIMLEHKNGNYYTIEQEYLADVKELIKKVSKKNAIDPKRIYLLGHSQGGGLLPLFLKENKTVAGAIMMAGNATSLADLMYYQLNYLMPLQAKTEADTLVFENMKTNALNAKKNNLPNTYPNDSLPMMYPFSYWNYLNKIDFMALAKNNKKPVLILQGARDYQVPITEFNKWKIALSNNQNYLFQSFEKLNHLFMEGTGKSEPQEYFNRSNIPVYVIDEITKWIKDQPRK